MKRSFETVDLQKNYLSLPPPEVRLVDRSCILPTPLDELGLVDIERLIQGVKSTVDSTHKWGKPSNVHHFYWPERYYSKETINDSKNEVSYRKFRNLPINKGLMSITFHNWLHKITEPPPLPSEEVLTYTVDAWEITSRVYRCLTMVSIWNKQAKRQADVALADHSKNKLGRLPFVHPLVIEESLSRHNDNLFQEIECMRSIPEEFRIFDPDRPLERLVREVGGLVAPKTRILTREVTEAA